MPTTHLPIQERRILEGLGSPWTADRLTDGAVHDAKELWKDLREALGYRRAATGWLTRSTAKWDKSEVAIAGVTLHAASNAAGAWASLEPAVQRDLAAALGIPADKVASVLNASVCPRSTAGCRAACVVARSANGTLPDAQKTRVARTLMTLLAPEHAVALTASELDVLRSKHGRDGARWRVNVSDDLRFEQLAPGLLDLAPLAYAYTKWTPAERPAVPGLRVVYSASERWTPEQVAEMCAGGHTVAVIIDVPKKAPLPETWAGVPVVDGDVTDDLWQHPHGVVVGLRAKGPTRAIRESMRTSGFAWPADTPVSLRMAA